MKNNVLEQAKIIIEKRREIAEKNASENKLKALSFPDFKTLYSNYISLIIDNAKNEIENKTEINKLEKEINTFLKNNDIGSITPLYFCKKCHDTGFIDGKKCSCLIKEINEILKKESGFINLESFENLKLDIFTNKDFMEKLYEKMQKWCHGNFKKSLIFISGDTGVGKTFLTKCMANELISQNFLVNLTTSFKLHQDFMKSYSCRDIEEKNEIIEKYLNVDILFIDDLGSEIRVPSITNSYLYQIINERKVAHKPTIITTNLDVYEIKDYYDERISSRIIDRENSICIQIKGDDLRLKK